MTTTKYLYTLALLIAAASVTATTTVETSTIEINDTVIYDTSYYTTDGSNWEPLALDGDVQRGAWYIGSASASLPQDVTHVAVYSCTWSDAWDCGNDWHVTPVATTNNTDDNTTTTAGDAWSDPATWPSGEVPSPGDTVTITSDMNVTLDVAPPELEAIRIEGGTLRFARQDINLTTGMITVHDRGEFRIGTEANPFEHKATITLTGTRDELPGDGHCGVKGICSFGGKLSFHGAVDGPTWTQLDEHANAGDTSITLEEPVSWNVGDEIVVTSTSYDPALAEQRTITAVSGNRVTFSEPLEFRHWGRMQYFGPDNEYPLDQRAEVMHLTRNIVVQGDEQSDADNFGGHVMAHNEHHMEQNNRADNGEEYYDLWQTMQNDKTLVPEISGVEFKRMGQTGVLARYPFHWHKYGNASGSYVEDSSIHDSYQRCITVHGTQDIRLERNVAYDVIGHCYFLEDGTEWDNLFVENIGALIHGFPTTEQRLIDSDNAPSVFWWNHPDNDFIGNVAAGSYGHGFWLDSKPHPTGETATEQIRLSTGVRNGDVTFGTFTDNVAHSTVTARRQANIPDVEWNVRHAGGIGLFIGGHNRDDGRDWNWFQCAPHHSPDEPRCDFTNNTLYYNAKAGSWINSAHSYARTVGSTFADNGLGLLHGIAHEENDIFIGLSDNTGNPGQAGRGTIPNDRVEESKRISIDDLRRFENQVGRSLPGKYAMKDDAQAGRELTAQIPIAAMDWQYDGAITQENVFINYADTEHFELGAMTMPSNAQEFTSLRSTMINADPYLGHEKNKPDRQTVFTSVDGTLTGTGQYTEIRQHYNLEQPSWLIDDTCTAAEGGEYHICTGSTASFHTIAVDGDRATLTQEDTGINVINSKRVWMPAGTYRIEETPQDEFYVRIHGGSIDHTWTFIVDTPSPLSTNPRSEPGALDADDVTRVSTWNEFQDGTESFATLYYDDQAQQEYVKVRGPVDYTQPLDDFFYYTNSNYGNENAYRLPLPVQ